MSGWDPQSAPPEVKIGMAGALRAAVRGAILFVLIFGGLAILLILRLFERPLHGLHRPWTPWIVQGVCKAVFVVLGLGHEVVGAPMKMRGAVVSNHASWLDIFALNARKRVYFVSKSEVARWPGIGWLARATGTVFITRERRAARAQQSLFEARLLAGHRLLFFPEGTSTDGLQVLPFKSTLFEAFFAQNLKSALHVQPVTLSYHAPEGQDPRCYGWWGDMAFAPHLLGVLAQRRHGRVRVVYRAPLRVADFEGRKALALACEEAVRAGLFHDGPMRRGNG